jgi:hypothetical protein
MPKGVALKSALLQAAEPFILTMDPTFTAPLGAKNGAQLVAVPAERQRAGLSHVIELEALMGAPGLAMIGRLRAEQRVEAIQLLRSHQGALPGKADA